MCPFAAAQERKNEIRICDYCQKRIVNEFVDAHFEWLTGGE